MSTVIYEFTANHATELWSTNPEKMVDGTETSYASTTTDGDIQCLITNECLGTDLGAISKVEIRAYAYADDNDQLILRPVFDGTDDGDNHTTVPGVTAGWGDWQDVTTDTNAPLDLRQSYTTSDGSRSCYAGNWTSQTFTPSVDHRVRIVKLKLYRLGSPGTVTVSIRATSDGKPIGTDLASGTTDGNTLTTLSSGEWREINLGNGCALLNGTMYAICIRAPAGDSDNRLYMRRDSSGTYAGGTVVWSTDSGSSWTISGAADLVFEEWSTWSWSGIQNLDCDVEQNDVSKGNTMHVGMVQAQVTYTAEAPPEGVAVQMMHYARMRRR